MSAYLIPLLVVLVGSIITTIIDYKIGMGFNAEKYPGWKMFVHKTSYIFFGGAIVFSVMIQQM